MVVPEDKKKAWRDRYRNGFFLAPMVRLGTLPMRLLCLEYGADLVWTSEIIDKSIIGTERTVDDKTGVISYMKGDREIFTTHPSEKDKMVFQMGSANPESALEAAKRVEQDVSGIDLNCGCPKKFSVGGGMGAALMSDPDKLCAILDILVKNLSVPVTCKIRVFDDVEKTLELVRRIAATGISALTVHCRTKTMRPNEKAMWGRLRAIVDEVGDLPVVLNGDITKYAHKEHGCKVTGATSVMTARGAGANPSIFRSEGMLPPLEAAVELTRVCLRTSNLFLNTKYILLQMHPETKSAEYNMLRSSRRYRELCEAMGLLEYYESEGKHFITENCEPTPAKKNHPKPLDDVEKQGVKRAREDDSEPADNIAKDVAAEDVAAEDGATAKTTEIESPPANSTDDLEPPSTKRIKI
ncbi:tRNA-dihydrouridine synthase 2 [Coemansia sp. Benny D115]|nr:tRNA-dihydrouridine synthase 2 [Coemansia sp. Benny D115]